MKHGVVTPASKIMQTVGQQLLVSSSVIVADGNQSPAGLSAAA